MGTHLATPRSPAVQNPTQVYSGRKGRLYMKVNAGHESREGGKGLQCLLPAVS